MPILLLLFMILKNSWQNCIWPDVDALFILDSTEYITSFQHQSEVDFLRKVMGTMKMANSRIALAQFTPGASIGMSLANTSYPESRIQELQYIPCEDNKCEPTSINSIARAAMTSSNRKATPDVILVLSNSQHPLEEVLRNEPLISPVSPLHVFYIVVGNQMRVSRFEPSAHTVGMKVIDFEYLPDLVLPLCQSVNGYVKGNTSTKFGPLCWIIIGSIILLGLIVLACLAYSIYIYHEENRKLRAKIYELERNLRKQNEYFTTQLHTQMQQQISNGEKYAEDLRKQQDQMKMQLDRQLEAAYQHQGKAVGREEPIVYLKDSGVETSPRIEDVKETQTDVLILDDRVEENLEEEEENAPEDPSETSSGTYESTEMDEEEINRKTHLALDHPARRLPPVDLMFLVDTSSSIGINNFDIQKNFICEILKDVDIAPGRSRVAMVQYAQDPSVVFNFDQYYSYQSVRKGVMRLSYTGGATRLSKALAFVGGLMYHEQNLKKVMKKHKYLPTPKHDRIQMLCLVSDGYSDDDADKESILLHDRLHIKIFAVVTRSFNKDKLIPITRFEGSVFTVHQRESVAIWMWRQQKIWAEHYSEFIEKEKRRQNRRDV
ncbi:unnamed protein product [Caenorhabditis angaria]|uniref:VWFA domain-containing protein n=1 Tax=Caenorhabditis angaria TaxID=860376 RepID=A0A9P1IX95_9PELO|nr:unnamed protein product [Caenorhabditis angaria]